MNNRIYITDVDELTSKFSNKAVFWKDIHSNYQGCNRFYAEKCGLQDFHQIIGLNDSIINPKYNKLYLKDDRSVISSQHVKHLYNPAFYPREGSVFVEGSLSPIYDNRERIFGVLGILDIKMNVFDGSFICVLNYIRQNNVANFLNKNKYYIDTEKKVSLSKNEIGCYFYAEFLNLSAKQISNLMNLSPRTVEKYLERVRDKRTCIATAFFNHQIQELILQNL